MKKGILFGAIFLCSSGYLASQNVSIPDANFKAELVNNTNINTDSDSEISVTEAESYIGSILVNGKNISDLTGIEAFTNIIRLDCQDNNLTSLDVSNNLELTRLHCGNNKLTSLDVSLNITMVEILCPNNELTSLNIANGKNRVITNSYGYMKSYGNPDLTCINVDPGFTISSTNGNYSKGWTIDAASNTSNHCYQPANYINIPDNNFKAGLLALHDLDFNDEISEYETEYITTLNLESKDISDLTGIEHFSKLEELNVIDNNLTSLDLSSNDLLVKLEAGDNSIASLSVPSGIEELNVNDNNLSSFDVSNNLDLKTLNLNNNNNITSIDVSNNTGLINLLVQGNELSSLDVSNNPDLVRIDCQENELTNLDVSNNLLLERLHCAFNQLTSLDVSLNTRMDEIFCYNNNLTVLNIANGRNTTINNSNGYMKAYNNPNLTCINVDAGLNTAAIQQQGEYSKGWTKDVDAMYSTTCNLTVSIKENNAEESLHIYPNPASSFITIAKGETVIYNLLGIKVLNAYSSGRIDVSVLDAGIYKVSQQNKTTKLIIE